jgi:uncharacterized protein (DUF1800 family)
MLTRRAFHQGLFTLAMSAALPRPGLANATPDGDEVFLNRLTFGATPATRESVSRLGREGWLEAELAKPAADAGLEARLSAARLRMNYEAGDNGEGTSWPAMDELRPLSALTADPADHVHLLDFAVGMDYGERVRPANEVISASIIRAVHADAQLREVMTQFWHDHFSVNSQKFEGTAVFFPSYDAILRENAFGNFRVMLGAVARSPAMLYYLNNEESRASPANENFARELLELHTLGIQNYLNDTAPDWKDVPGALEGASAGYIDQDVYEVARAFTGWTVGDGRYISDGVDAPKTGRFHYVEAWHDPYQKRILGVEFPPNRAAMADGDQVLDLLSVHPGTARFVVKKIIRRLLSDDPDPGMIDRVAGVFLAAADAPDQIAQVIRAVVADPLFASTPPSKIRRPFEFIAALTRATGVNVSPTELGWDWQMSRAGWHQHTYGPPTGHPDRMSRWASASTLGRMVDYALYAHDDWFGLTTDRIGQVMPVGAPFRDWVAGWRGRLLGPGASDVLPELVAGLGVGDPAEPVGGSDDDLQGLATSIVAFAAVSPAFLLR